MAGEVIGGGRVERRSYRTFGLVQFAIMAVLALAMAIDGSDSPSSRLVLALASLGVGVLVLGLWCWALPWVAGSWVVEVDRHAVRWHGGWRRRDRVIPRAQVVTARPSKNARFLQLRFYDAAGKRVGLLPLFQFPAGQVVAALRRHDWPVPEPEQFADALSRWR